MKKVLFISSTGGHFSELLQLKSLFEKYDSYIITEKDKTSEKYKSMYGDKFFYLPYGTRSKLFTYIFKYFYLCLKTIFHLPEAVRTNMNSGPTSHYQG